MSDAWKFAVCSTDERCHTEKQWLFAACVCAMCVEMHHRYTALNKLFPLLENTASPHEAHPFNFLIEKKYLVQFKGS